MDLFSQQYNSLLAYAGAIIKNRGLTIDASDLVNDAYIKFVESGRQYNRDEIKRLIVIASDTQKVHQTIYKDSTAPRKASGITGQLVCNKCKQPKQVNEFHTSFEKGVQRLRKVCKECINKQKKERGRRSYSPYVSTAASRKYNLARQLESIKKLDDTYIKSRLKASRIDITPDAINQKRIEIQNKRRNKLRLIHKTGKSYSGSRKNDPEYHKQWYDNNREKWNTYMKERYKKKREEKVAAGLIPKKAGRPFKYQYPAGLTKEEIRKVYRCQYYSKNKEGILSYLRERRNKNRKAVNTKNLVPKKVRSIDVKRKRGRPTSILKIPLTIEERTISFDKARSIINEARTVPSIT